MPEIPPPPSRENVHDRKISRLLCFSDVDGTLVHYEDMTRYGDFVGGDQTGTLTLWKYKAGSEGHKVIRLPPSHSGTQGSISLRTLHLIAKLRAKGVLFVLITGGRLATLLQRLPFLPASDAYVCENGGRIFYPDSTLSTACPIVEDMHWRLQHSAAVGPPSEEWTKPDSRQGALWDAYRALKERGCVPDAASYTTCWRLKLTGTSRAELEAIVETLPSSLSCSFNLGCLDVYPSTSGKSRAGIYLMTHFKAQTEKSVLLCDDDNDLKLAAIVSRVYLPSITSQSVAQAVQAQPAKFTCSSQKAVLATEEMLEQVLDLA